MTREQFWANILAVKQCSRTLEYLKDEDGSEEYQEELEEMNEAIDNLMAFYDEVEDSI